jgi:hypothetical protein
MYFHETAQRRPPATPDIEYATSERAPNFAGVVVELP